MVDFTAQNICKAGSWSGAFDYCLLSYDERFLRRKVINTVRGHALLIDLAQTVSLDDGDAFEIADGRYIHVKAARESLLQIEGNLVQLAWHIGNRHTPCEIGDDRLLIQNDPVIAHMLEHLGAIVSQVSEPFTPEGGAYGHGRTHSHDHGHTAHDH